MVSKRVPSLKDVCTKSKIISIESFSGLSLGGSFASANNPSPRGSPFFSFLKDISREGKTLGFGQAELDLDRMREQAIYQGWEQTSPVIHSRVFWMVSKRVPSLKDVCTKSFTHLAWACELE